MTDALPLYVTVVFVLTTLLTIGLLLRSFRDIRPPGPAQSLITFLIPFWMILTAMLSIGGFYSQFEYVPPRVAVFGILPSLLLIAVLFVFFRTFIDRLSLKLLTLLHIIRIPVELVLLWLFQAGLIPQIMTFEGRNFDVLSGISAPIVYFIVFRRRTVNRTALIVWNLITLGLLLNIAIIANLSFPSPMQHFGLDQPNIGLTYFPFIWLPVIIVPIVLFAHLASLWQLLRRPNI
jgi:hypothetical protein